jgi:HlyD family secretion protein
VAKVTASGTVALVTVQVGSQVSGRIKQLHATFTGGEEGPVIANLDLQLFKAALARRANHSARRRSAQGQVQAQDAARQLTRTKGWPSATWSRRPISTPRKPTPMSPARRSPPPRADSSRRAALNQAEVNLTIPRSTRRSTAW